MPNAVETSNAAEMLPTAPISLILDLLESLESGARPYAEVIDAWRTSCPRLTVWEDCVDGGYLSREKSLDGGIVVALTAKGREALRRAGRGNQGSAKATAAMGVAEAQALVENRRFPAL